MCDFKNHYDDNIINKLYKINITKLNSYLTEVNKNLFLSNTDEKRIEKARREIRKNQPRVRTLDDGTEMMEYTFKAYDAPGLTSNHDDKQPQHGYLIYNPENLDIINLWCSCSDFFYRLWYPLVTVGLATWNIPSKYKRFQQKEHNKQPTKRTNPNEDIYVCKHLYALISEFVEDKPKKINKPKPKLEPEIADDDETKLNQPKQNIPKVVNKPKQIKQVSQQIRSKPSEKFKQDLKNKVLKQKQIQQNKIKNMSRVDLEKKKREIEKKKKELERQIGNRI
jgi:hypothetical protein